MPLVQAVTEKELYHDICNAPLDFESAPWDSLSGGQGCEGMAGCISARCMPPASPGILGPHPTLPIKSLKATTASRCTVGRRRVGRVH